MRKFLVIGLVALASCANPPTLSERRKMADALATWHGWQRIVVSAGTFDLVAYLPRTPGKGDELTLYIEGDGFAWVSPSRPSGDPTPNNPIGLKLALAQPEGNVAYLARPCQYVDATATQCSQAYWTEGRFASEVVDAENRALDVLKAQFAARQLTLVGYSGGGAVAALIAARRNDVARLITVAGNLDHAAWTRHHDVHPLTGSLNPAAEIDGLRSIKQWHFVGGKDRIVPPSLVESFAQRFPPAQRPTVVVEPTYAHDCCWVENWPRLIAQTRRQE